MGFKVQVSENNTFIKQMQICENGDVMRIYNIYIYQTLLSKAFIGLIHVCVLFFTVWHR